MDQLRAKIEELKVRFDSTLDEMLKTEEKDVHHIPRCVTRLQTKLSELYGEVERIIHASFKDQI